MKVRITDLLDHYHDAYVKLDAPEQKGAMIYMDQYENNKKHSSPAKKILIVAACLVLILTGVAFFRLAPSIIYFDEEQGGALENPISIQEPEAAEEERETEDFPAEKQTAEMYVAELGLTLEVDGEEGSILRLLYNRESLYYTWFLDIDRLEELLYSVSPEGNMSDCLRNAEFQDNLTSWMNMFLDAYMSEAYISFSDGSSFIVGGGAAGDYEDGTFLEFGSVMPEHEYADLVPECLVINGEEYPLAPADEDTQAAERNRIKKREEIAAQIVESNTEETESVEDGSRVYPEVYPIEFRVDDPDGDGYLTADLALPVETEAACGTVCRFTLDISKGEFKWFYDSQELVDSLYHLSPAGDMSVAMRDTAFAVARLDFMNCALETYLSDAYLGFEDGTEVCIGCGDIVGFSDGLFWDGYRIEVVGQDEAEALGETRVSYLKINDVIYNFI